MNVLQKISAFTLPLPFIEEELEHNFEKKIEDARDFIIAEKQ